MSGKWLISRRTALRGLGATVALPLLDAMIPPGISKIVRADTAGDKSGAAAVKAPTRMVAVFFPNGRWMPDWTPAAAGSAFSLPPTLAPLESVRNQMLILTGLTLDNARAKGDGAGDHARSASTFLTGVHPYKTAGADIKAGISVDQVAAEQIGKFTRLPSLELGLEHGAQAGTCDSGYSCAYVSNVSWRSAQTPMPPETDPGAVFDRLFGTTDPAALRRLRYRRSILDMVADDARDLDRRLGQADRRKLDEFTTSIREVERRVEKAATEKPLTPPGDFPRPQDPPDDAAESLRLFYDLIALALRTDSTRIATFMIGRDGGNRTYRELGLTEGHHTVSHHGNDPQKIDAVKKIDKFHMESFGYFLKTLASTPEGDGSLLDHCMVMGGSGISDGDRHNHEDLPVLIAGRGNGVLAPGRHVQYARNTPLCNLYLSMLDAMGVRVDRFGDSTDRLPQLT